MRLTINLDDDLYAMARSHAIATKTSLSKSVGDLLRRATAPQPSAPGDAANYFDPVLQLQVSRSSRPLTEQNIQDALDDEDLKHLEAAGWAPKKPSQP